MLASPRTSAPPTNGSGTGPSSPRGNSLDEIKRWSETDVAAWLSSHNLAHHAPTFARNDINGNVLMDVDQAALKDMGIATVGDRIRLFSAIKQLRKRCTESASYLNRMAAMRTQQQDRQARYRATYTTPDVYGIQIQEATLDQQLNGNQPSPVTNDAGQSKKRGSQMRPPPLRLSGSSASNIPSTPPPYPSPNSLSAFHSGQGLGLSQARGLTPGSAANRTPNPANVGQGRSPIPASFRNLEATTSNSRSSSPISMHRKTNSAVGGSMLTQGNATSMGVQPRQFGSYNGQPNYPGALHSSSAVPITPSPTSTTFDARGISRPHTAESATRDTGLSMSVSGSGHGAASGYGSASGSGPVALTASTSTVGAAAAPPLTPITEANSSIYSSGYAGLAGSNSSSGYSRSRPMGHAGHTASSSSSYGSRTIPYGDIPRPSLEDLKRRTIKFIGDDGTTRIINVSDCRDAHDVLSKVLKKFGKSTAGNGYLPTLGQQPLPNNNGEARYVIVATSSEGATRDLRPEELLAICHAPQPYDPLRERGLTLRRISPGASGMDASHASASTTATRRMARSGRNKLEAFFGERLQDGPYPVDGSSLAGDVGQVTTAGKKMNRASTVSILTGLGAGALASIAGSPIGPSSPPLPSADSGSLRDRTISRNGGLARPTSSSHRATLNPASFLPRKARNFMGQRPPSELISSHLADYFPATEKKILERTARRSIAGRASASIKSSNKRDSTWSYHPGLSEQDEEQEMPPPLPTKYRAGELGSTAPMLPPVVISHNSLDDPMDDWSQNLRGAGTPDPSAADAASPGAQYATVKQQRSSRPPLGSSRASIDSARSRKSYASQLRAARGLTAGASSSANSFRTRPSSTFNDAASMMTVDEITQEVENRRASKTMSILGDQEDGGANWVVDEDGNPIPIGPAGRSGGSSSRRLKKSSTASPSLNTRPSSGHSIDYSVEEEGSQQDSSSDILPGEEDGDDDISLVGPGPAPASAVLERASPEAPEASSADTGYTGTETDEDPEPSSEEEDSSEDEEEGVISEAQVATAATTTTLASSASPNTGNKKASSVTGKPQMKWIKGALIGAGSFGSVFLAMNGKTGLLMAVKQVELPGGQTANDQKKKRMLDALEGEIELLKELQHENIVQYLDSYADGTHLNIFLEYVPGGSVVALLRNYGAFEEPLVRNFVKQILQGLSFLHGKDIVHRDIKGANILVDNKSCIKISDFGISKKVESDLLSDARSHRPSLQGSVFWMAPEVVKQTSYTLKADIWSLGCLVVEMMSGTHPFPNLNQMQALFRIGSGNSRPSLPEEISDMAKDFLDRTFEMDHEKRPTSETLLQHPFITEDYVPPVEGGRKVQEEEEGGEEEDD